MPEDEQLRLLEARISDLETKFSEMSQKSEDVEDLLMVEQAGILEIKNMIEEVKVDSSPESATILPKFEERLKRIENFVSFAPKSPSQSGVQDLMDKIHALEMRVGESSGGTLPVSEVDRIYRRIDEMERKFLSSGARTTSAAPQSEISNYLDSLKKRMDELSTKEAETGAVMKNVESMVGQLKAKPNDTDVQQLHGQSIDTRLSEIEGRMEFIEKGGSSQSSEDKSGVDEKDILDLHLKIDAIERSLESIKNRPQTVVGGANLDTIPGQQGNVTGLSETVSELSRKVGENTDDIARMSADILELSNKMDAKNKELQSSLFSVLKSFKERVTALEIERQNASPVSNTDPQEIDEKMSSIASSLEERYKKELEQLKDSIGSAVRSSGASSSMDAELTQLLDKISFLESRMKAVERDVGKNGGPRPVVLE